MAKRARRRAPSPEPLEVFIGDEHVGSLFGPAPKPLQTTREQAWLTALAAPVLGGWIDVGRDAV